MKILQLIYESYGSPFGFGGAGVRAYEIYKRLKDRHEITLLCMRYPGARDGEIEGLRHVFVGTKSNNLTVSVMAYTLKVWDYVKRYSHTYDVIIENFLPATPFFTRLLTDRPVILQVQGIMAIHALSKFNPLYGIPMYLVERYYPHIYRHFIFVSEVTRQKVLSRCSGRGMTSPVIPNGIDSALLEIEPSEGDYILFFSRIDIYTKGLDILIRAFEDIYKEYKDLRLILAGYEFNPIGQLLSGLAEGVKQRIHYAGFVSGDEKVRLLSGARLFVLPSRHESAPVSIIEAAACGKPVIVSDIPELGFVQDNGFGLSFPCNSVEGLARSMRILLNNSQLRQQMGQRGRLYAKRSLWDNIAIDFERALKGV